MAQTKVGSGFVATGAVGPTSLSTGAPYWDTSGNVGIGTSSPSFTAGGGVMVLNATQANYRLADGTNYVDLVQNSGAGYLWNRAANFLSFGTSNTERMRIDSSGNAFIGTASATWDERLGVRPSGTGTVGIGVYSSSASYTGSLVRVQAENTTGASFKLYEGRGSGGAVNYWVDGAGGAYFASNVGIGTSSPSAKLHSYATSGTTTTLGKFEAAIGSYTGTSLIAANTLTDSSTYNLFSCITDSDGDAGGPYTKFLVRGDGNVGIGTSSPAQKLTVVGTGTPTIRIEETTSGGNKRLEMWVDSATAIANIGANQSGQQLAFQTTGTERMRIDSSGNAFVGTTTSYGRFTVVPTTTQYSFASNAPNSSGTYYHFHCLAAGTTVGTIASTSTTTTYGTSSDYRLKHDVQTMTSGLATIAALKPVTYKWKIDDSIGEGFIAHELAEHIPFAVVGEKDAVDEEGNIRPQNVDYSKIVVHLVAAIQELTAKVTALEAKVGS